MVLDHLEHLELSEAEVDEHFDARMALARLGEGLSWLYRTVGELERQARADAAREDVKLAVAGGILDNKPMGLLSCAFQWYASAICCPSGAYEGGTNECPKEPFAVLD